jgi:hypothetical protein
MAIAANAKMTTQSWIWQFQPWKTFTCKHTYTQKKEFQNWTTDLPPVENKVMLGYR